MSVSYLREVLIPPINTEEPFYTVPDASIAVLSSLRITNRKTETTNVVVTVTLYPNGGATAYYLLDGMTLAPGRSMDVFSGVPCTLEAGDVLKVKSSLATTPFILSFMLINRSQ